MICFQHKVATANLPDRCTKKKLILESYSV